MQSTPLFFPLVLLSLLPSLCFTSYIQSPSTLTPSIITSSFHSNIQQWEPYVKTATQTALDHLMQVYKVPVMQWKEDQDWKENTLVGISSLYTLSVEIDSSQGKYGGLGFEFSFVDTNSTKFDNLWSLTPPSLTTTNPTKKSSSAPLLLPHTNTLSPSPSHNSPLMESLVPYFEETPTHSGELNFIALQGPVQLYFPDQTTDVRIKIPRDMDTLLVKSIAIERGATVFVSGAILVELREPVEIDNTQTTTHVNLKQAPILNIYGNKVTITNGTSEGKLKLQKKGGFGSFEITNSSMIVQSDNIPLFISDSNVEQINYALIQMANSLGSSEIPKVRRILGGKIQSVLSFLIPIDISFDDGDDNNTNNNNNTKSQSGGFDTYQAFVVQEYDSIPKKESQKIVSLWRSGVQNTVSFEPSLLSNGTISNLGDFAKLIV